MPKQLFVIVVEAAGMRTVLDWIRDTPAFADEKVVRIMSVSVSGSVSVSRPEE